VTARTVTVGDIDIATGRSFAVIAGPCQIEGLDHALMMAERIAAACAAAGRRFIYKSSFDKANRSSHETARGIGIDEGLRILETVRTRFGCPVLTDVHDAAQCAPVADVVDVLQIPAFLCRQTDLLLAAGRTGAAVNVKKGQFLAPWDMQHVVEKCRAAGNHEVMVCERGVSFGYNTLVADMRGLAILRATGCPVVFDATHSVQQPGGRGDASGGQREMIPVVARAAVAAGVAGVFMEIHPDPDRAWSDGPNQWPLARAEELLGVLVELDRVVKARPYAEEAT
jgi:2-dehydro-3-deoxyphosphooctonate aldolase (KDO 8-P synthase)